MKVFKAKWLSILLVFILTFTSLPLSMVSAQTANQTVSVNKVVTPLQIKEGGESEVRLDVKGSPPVGFVKPNDVILVIDRSGSMDPKHNNGDNKMAKAKEAAQHFIDQIKFENHQVGVVDYSDTIKGTALSTNAQELKDYIGNIQPLGGTDTHLAIERARNELKNHRPDAQPVIVLMTDGAASNFSAALQQAEAAKKEGIVFYTVGLITDGTPNEAAITQLMKNMATTEKHHYIENISNKLKEVYEKISKEIGIASAYDVVIEDVVSPEFEIVPGSYENSIPVPQVVGNKLTWNFLELKEQPFSLTYKVRHKKGSPVGKLPLGASPVQVSYKDHKNQQQGFQVEQPMVDVSFYGPTIASLEPNKGTIKGGETITINGAYFKSDSKVSFGNNAVANVQYVSPEKLIVTAPAGEQGVSEVKVTNPDGQVAVFNYQYYADPVIDSITPNSGSIKGENQIVIKGNYFMNGAVVTIGGKAATTVSVTPKEIKVTVPAAEKEAVVPVIVTNPDNTTTKTPGSYSYVNGPSILSITPNKGLVAGGNVVKITGTKFVNGAEVFFNATKVTAQFESAESIHVTVPAWNTVGSVNVKIVNPDGQEAVLNQGYHYVYPDPVFTSITPNKGDMKGGYYANIIGNNFNRNTKVSINNIEATTTYISNTELSVLVPASTVHGPVAVKIVNGHLSELTTDGAFSYNAPPEPEKVALTSITPNKGLVSGNYYVTLKGTGFTKESKIHFGTLEIPTTYISATELSGLVPPAQKAGAVNVAVVNTPTNQASLEAGFTYTTPPEQVQPTIVSVSPSKGELTGNYPITVKGTEFHSKSVVHIAGQVAVTEYVSPTELKATVPATNTPGPVSVKVVNAPNYEVELPGGFTYNPLPVIDPTITSVTPNNGAMAGYYYITIQGKDFDRGTTAYIDDQGATTTYISTTELSVQVPAAKRSGAVDVKVVTGAKGTTTMTGGFTYNKPVEQKKPTIVSVSPNKGEMTGNYPIVVTGTEFHSKSVVYIGGQSAVTEYVSPTELKATVPANNAPGPVTVKVVNAPNYEVELPGGFTYNPLPVIDPTITSVTPNNGAMAGYYYITIQGKDFDRGTTAYIDDQAATTTYISTTELSVQVPAAKRSGAVDVKVVTGTKGTTTMTGGFTYNKPVEQKKPTIVSVSPNKGEMTGNYPIVVREQ
ncbi:IPT/TIG domain-containing protein, partial [Paenibacillus arenosi]|nr:IPT/TIG domain-containing protein [Paenibacillus arenosi]